MKITIADYGLCTEAAIKLAQAGHQVAYYSEWHESFPKCVNESVGLGLEGITRVNNLHASVDRSDMLVCFDTHLGDLVNHYKGRLPTFGAGSAERLEQDRPFAKQLLKDAGLPVGPYKIIKGIDNLIDYLRENKDKWIKFNGQFRGDSETFHHSDWPTTMRSTLGELLMSFGAMSDTVEAIAEDPILSKCEVGYDGLYALGRMQDGLVGYEAKDKAYAGVFRRYKDMPDCIRKTNQATVEALSDTPTWVSSELRLPGPYLIDPCIRHGHPPMSAQLEHIDNYAECVVNAALEKPFTVNPCDQYSVVMEVKSEQSKDHWLPIKFDQRYRHLIKLQRACRKDGQYWVLPGSYVACNVVGLGHTLKAARAECEKALKTVDLPGMTYSLDALDKLENETIPLGKKLGVPF